MQRKKYGYYSAMTGEQNETGLQPAIRKFSGALAALMTAIALLWNIDFFEWLGFAFIPEQYYAIILALALPVVFMTVRVNRSRDGRMPWYDGVLAAFAAAVLLYVGSDFLNLKDIEFSNSTTKVIVLGAIISILVIDGLRRSAGYILLGVLSDSGIKSIYDLAKFKGKRITDKYTSLSIIVTFIEATLANGKVGYGDFKRVPVSTFAKGMFALGQGKVDISWVSLGSGDGRKVYTQLRKHGEFRYLDMDPSPAAMARFRTLMPAGHIVQIPYIMFTSKGMDAETVYKVTKVLAQNKGALAKSMGAFRRMDVKNMASKHVMPYHPGAIRAFKELGIKVGG